MKKIKLFKEYFDNGPQHTGTLSHEISSKDINDLQWGPLYYNKGVKDLLTKFYFTQFNHNKSVEERFNDDISVIISKISKDCQPFVNQFRKEKCESLIYRGVDNISNDYIKSQNINDINEKNPRYPNLFNLMMEKITRKNRKPKDTPLDISKTMDDIFQKELGIRLRSQGVFGISSIGVTLHYGYPFILIPIGNFDFYWGAVDDLWNWAENSFGDYYEEFGEEDGKFIGNEEYDSKSNARFKEDMEEIAKTYKKDNLKGAIQSRHEITFVCDKYLLVNSMFSVPILKWLKNEYKFIDNNLIY
jgi:hypothetical protein